MAVWIDCNVTPAASLTPSALDRIVRADTQTQRRPGDRLRALVLSALKWPALAVVFAVSVVALALTAAALTPLVWLKPHPDVEGR